MVLDSKFNVPSKLTRGDGAITLTTNLLDDVKLPIEASSIISVYSVITGLFIAPEFTGIIIS